MEPTIISASWGFYGRRDELSLLHKILTRNRWFFVQIAGRRRIGKTALIQQAMQRAGRELRLYMQIPDSDATGVLAACNDYLETFGLHQKVHSLLELARLIAELASKGYVIAIDEFQYFNRSRLFDFCSLLQKEVDHLMLNPNGATGGLIVLGSLHTEMSALLEDRSAPLFNRTTDVLDLDHLDIASLLELLQKHGDPAPEQLLFLWNLFEGVPKFYRDAYEQGALAADRQHLLKTMFFSSSSPLRNEADNWFLKELHGRYDTILQFIARHPGCSNADIIAAIASFSPQEGKQAGGYLKILGERYRMVERRLPIFARNSSRSGRYYLKDNFLRSWLMALQRPVSAMHFRPEEQLIRQADSLLADAEGHALETLAGKLYEELSRKGLGDFELSERIEGYWDRGDVEIDLVALSQTARTIRFVSCKRNPMKLQESIPALMACSGKFLGHHKQYRDWKCEYCAIAPSIPEPVCRTLEASGVRPQPLSELLRPLF
ncbi:ATP-binding protein [Chlorobium sp. N1]|nr:DUF234 domain-containing protein [Chlorobium sp. N1]TCD46886.1 ATP-binding protein [Chlorobium sp. N1]